MIRYFAILTTLLCCLFVRSQDGKFNLGARSAGMAGASLTLSDGWSAFNNVGGLGALTEATVNVSYQNRYDVSALQVVGLAYTHPTEWINGGISFYRFGDDLYSQQKLTFSIGNSIQMVSLGGGISIVQYRLESIGVKQVTVFEFGGIAEIIPELVIGTHIFNISQTDLNETESVPIVMKIGISYRPVSSLMINTELVKDLDLSESLVFGLEYELIPLIRIRSGIDTRPRSASFGLGFYLKGFSLDYAYSMRDPLGSINELSLSRSFSKK